MIRRVLRFLSLGGEIPGYPTVGRSPIGIPVPSGGYYIFLDCVERDTELLAKRRAAQPGALPVGSVVNIVPDPELAGTPLLRRTPLPPFQATVTR